MTNLPGSRVVLDTSVLISAVAFGGKPEQVVKLAALGRFVFLASPQILGELSKVLRNKFDWSDAEVRGVVKALSDISTIVVPHKKIRKLSYDPDNRILECAVEGRARYMVTSDKKHLLRLSKFKNTSIISVNEFLQIMA